MAGSLASAPHTVPDAYTLAAFRRSGLPDLPSYLVSDDFGAVIFMLIGVPLAGLAFGLVGGVLGAALRPPRPALP